ncbi:MAG: SprB repeat-containing protein [Bacteroidetes bacterium]|nr:SprB repeat-containing protein [Bacteroidota bacterium]
MHNISTLKNKWLTVRKYCWFFVPFCRILLFGMEAYGNPVSSEELINSTPALSGIDGTTDYAIQACAGTSVCFDIFSAGNTENASLSWTNTIPGASFSSDNTSAPSGHFCWAIPSDAGQTDPYTFQVYIMSQSKPEAILGTYTYTIYVPQLVISSSVKASLCRGKDNGSISISVSGGQSPYSYEWATGISASNSADHLRAGNYEVLVTDDNGCSLSYTTSVEEEYQVDLSALTIPASCHSNDGSAELSATGGFPPYSFYWNNTSVDKSTVNSLYAGIYKAEVIDSKGCQTANNVFVEDMAPKLTVSSIRPVQCKGGSDGMIYVEGSGRSALIYSWEPNHETGPRLKNLTNGTYTVTATDMEGCSTKLQTTVAYVHENPTLSLGMDRSLCLGDQVLLDAGNFNSVQWTDNSTARVKEVTKADTYSVTVTDANGCQSVDAVRLDFVDCSKPEEFNSINLYPSPVRDLATLSMVSTNEQPMVFEIHDLMGKLVWEKKFTVVAKFGRRFQHVTGTKECIFFA